MRQLGLVWGCSRGKGGHVDISKGPSFVPKSFSPWDRLREVANLIRPSVYLVYSNLV